MKYRAADDPEMTAPPDLGPLWAQRPAEEARQTVLPIRGTLEAAYQEWRASEIGERVYHAFCLEAMTLVKTGVDHRSQRDIWEALRLRFPAGTLNNNHLVYVAKGCADEYPETRQLFRFRQRGKGVA